MNIVWIFAVVENSLFKLIWKKTSWQNDTQVIAGINEVSHKKGIVEFTCRGGVRGRDKVIDEIEDLGFQVVGIVKSDECGLVNGKIFS